MYIFLDIDGVLNRSCQWRNLYTLDTGCINAFVKAMQPYNPKIILISSWRKGFLTQGNKNNSEPIRRLEQLFQEHNIRIVSKTEVLLHQSRDKEIEQFLVKHPTVEQEGYIILDDDINEYASGYSNSRLYLIAAENGFSSRDAAVLKKVIKSHCKNS